MKSQKPTCGRVRCSAWFGATANHVVGLRPIRPANCPHGRHGLRYEAEPPTLPKTTRVLDGYQRDARKATRRRMGERRRDKELCHADAALRGMHRDIVDEVAVRRTRLIFQQLVQAGGGREVPGVREQIPDNLPIDLGDPTSVRVAGELVGEHSKVFEEVRAVGRALDAVHRIEVAVGQLTHSRYHESVSTAMMPPRPGRELAWGSSWQCTPGTPGGTCGRSRAGRSTRGASCTRSRWRSPDRGVGPEVLYLQVDPVDLKLGDV